MSVRRVTMNGVARLGVGIALVGRRAEMTALGAALEHAAEGKPTGVLLAGDAGVGKSRLVVRDGRARGHRGLRGAHRPLPRFLGVAAVPAVHRGRRPARGGQPRAAHGASRAGAAAAGPRGGRGGGSRARAAAGVRRHALRARFAHRRGTRAAGARGPALGRSVEPGSPGVPPVAAHRAAARRAGHLPHRRPAPAPPAAAGAVRAGAPARRRAAGSGAARRRATRSTSSSGWPTAASPRRWCAAPPSAARATRSSPRSWCRPRPSGLPVRARRGADGPHRGAAARHPAGAAAGRGRRAAGRARPARGRVASCPTTSWSRPCAMPSPTTCWWPTAERCLRLPARAAARGHLHRAAARRAQQAARPLRQAASPSSGEESAAAELAHHAVAAHDLPLALAASVRAAREADRRAAPAEVLLHVERALELWDAVPEPERVSGMTEVRLTTWAAWMASASGDPDRGIALGRRALDLAERGRDHALTATLSRRYAMRLLELTGRDQEALEVSCRAVELRAALPRHAGDGVGAGRPRPRAVQARPVGRGAGERRDRPGRSPTGWIPTMPTSSARGPMR